MRKFLVVNMNYLGDALLTTPAISALRQAYPEARIDTVVGAGAAAEVLRNNPDLDNIIARTARGSWARVVQTYRLLKDGQYTDVIILPPLPAYAAAAWLARTPRRVGQAGRGMNRFLTELRQTRATHMADAMLDTMPLPPGSERRPRRLIVTVDQASKTASEALMTEVGIAPNRPVISVNVGATRPQKRWLAASFAETLDLLADTPCVLIGSGEEDTTLAAEVMRLTQSAQPVNLVGRTTVKTLAAVLQRSDLLLSADSGPMHLATAVGTATLALFGSTDPAVTGPFDTRSETIYKALPCAPCGNHPTCDGRYDCLRAITPEEVAHSARRLLRLGRGGLIPLPQRESAAESPIPPRKLVTLPSKGEYSPGASVNGLGIGSNRSSIIRRILIATKFRFIGDTLLAIPIFRAARAQWPEAHIALLTGKNARVLLQNNPYLDEIIEFDPYKSGDGWEAYADLVRRHVSLVRQLRAGRFDLCLALNRSFHSALTPWLSGVNIRSGFRSEGRGPLLNCRVDYDREKSEVACYFDVLHAVAPEAPVNPALELWVSPEEARQARARLREAWGTDIPRECLVGIQPGASQPKKRWSAACFARLADDLIRHDPHLRIALIGGPDERDAAEEMRARCAAETLQKTISFTGACDLRGSLALVAQLGLFVGNDTAVMHSAVALDVPTVALFGPTNPRKWGNYGPSHRVLESPDGTMASLDAEEVRAAAQALLAQGTLAPTGGNPV